MPEEIRLRLSREQLEFHRDYEHVTRRLRCRTEAEQAASRWCSCVSDKTWQIADEGIRLMHCCKCHREWYEWIPIEEL